MKIFLSQLTMHSTFFSLSLIFIFFLLGSATHINHHRRLLHQPLFPFNHPVPPTSIPSINKTKPPFPSPSPHLHPFFLLFPPSPPPSNDLATFPANISSLILSRPSHSSNNSITSKFTAILISVSILSAAFVTALVLFLFLHHRYSHPRDKSYDEHERTDSLWLVSPNRTPSHAEIGRATKNTSPLVSCRKVNKDVAQSSTAPNDCVPLNYQSIGSPELRPLPPLPRQYFKQHPKIAEMASFEDEDAEFFSARGSSGDRGSPNFTRRNFQYQYLNHYNSSNDSLSNSSSGELCVVNFPAPPRFILRPVEQRSMSSSAIPSGSTHNSPVSQVSSSSAQNQESTISKFGNYSGRYVSIKLPPPPPPLPPKPKFWESSTVPKPRVVVEIGGPSMPICGSSEAVERRNEESMKPKFKPLHWDKVRATSDRAMVWDKLKSSSFPLNEEMFKILFTVKDGPVVPVKNQEKQVLNLKKSQNIAILLRTLHITSDEVCEALLQGNADTLGRELLQSLIKMAPTKEEERKLKDIKDESTPSKLKTLIPKFKTF